MLGEMWLRTRQKLRYIIYHTVGYQKALTNHHQTETPHNNGSRDWGQGQPSPECVFVPPVQLLRNDKTLACKYDTTVFFPLCVQVHGWHNLYLTLCFPLHKGLKNGRWDVVLQHATDVVTRNRFSWADSWGPLLCIGSMTRLACWSFGGWRLTSWMLGLNQNQAGGRQAEVQTAGYHAGG